MKKKIAGYEVTDLSESKITRLMSLEQAMKFAFNHCLFNQCYINRKYVDNTAKYLTMVTRRTVDCQFCAVPTTRERNIMRKFANEARLELINEQ